MHIIRNAVMHDSVQPDKIACRLSRSVYFASSPVFWQNDVERAQLFQYHQL